MQGDIAPRRTTRGARNGARPGRKSAAAPAELQPGTTTKRRVSMSPAWVSAVKPEDAPIEWRDTESRGLVLRVEASGLKSWVLRYTFAGRDRRYKLGTWPATTLAAARTRARGILALAEGGTDPQLERERLRVGQTVEAAVAAWVEDERLGPSTRWKGGLEGGSARSFLPHVRRFQRELGTRKLPELTRKNIEKFVIAAEAPATRNRALTALRLFFWWAGRKQLIETDPSAGIGKEREAERSRLLSDAELGALVRGFDPTRYGRVVRLLALTGLRRDEVLGAEWAWLDTDAATLRIPASFEKTGRTRGRDDERLVALSPQALALLKAQRERLFSEGLGKTPYIFATSTGERPHRDALKPTLNVLRGLRSNGQPASKDPRAPARTVVLGPDAKGEHGTVHDIRRTVATALRKRLKVYPWIVEEILGHARPKIERTYQTEVPLDEARAALTRWAELLDGILNATTAGESAAP